MCSMMSNAVKIASLDIKLNMFGDLLCGFVKCRKSELSACFAHLSKQAVKQNEHHLFGHQPASVCGLLLGFANGRKPLLVSCFARLS